VGLGGRQRLFGQTTRQVGGVAGLDPAGQGAGCSDLAWRRQRSFLAKPGFLPATTFTVTSSGLVWAIDHIQAASPGPGAGRHFTARGLQLAASSVDQAISYLRQHPSAGGFTYTIGDLAGRIVTVESSAGQHRADQPPATPIQTSSRGPIADGRAFWFKCFEIPLDVYSRRICYPSGPVYWH
jgi:Acyl-coenzyme A:6-aminopenicillanic acid acyl-transferase